LLINSLKLRWIAAVAKLVCSKSRLRGQVGIPGSKSHTIRAVVFGSLADGRTIIRRPLVSLDARSAAACYRTFGAQIDLNAGSADEPVWRIEGLAGQPRLPENVIDVGNSGTTLRMALGTASLLDRGAAVFTGDDQIRRRTAGPLLRSLNDLGGRAFSTRGNDLAPYVVSGPLTGGKTGIQAVSSQYLSSLLACCPLASGDSEITVTLLNEKPYVEMTLWWLETLGLRYENQDFKRFRIPGGQRISGFEIAVPGDFSSATFFLCAAALAGDEVRLTGLDMSDTQGDKAVIDYLRQMGASIDIDKDTIIVRQAKLHGARIDLNATPDALPAMAVTACFAEGPTHLANVPQARMKETDRIAVMTRELTKLGAKVEELPDGLIVHSSRLRGGLVDGHGDHRVVMALAMAGLVTDEPVEIEGSEAAAVTFPDFVRLMTDLGAALRETA